MLLGENWNENLQINYFLNGNPVQQGDRVKCQFENGFALLSIDEVSEKDAGYYVFQAENDIGQPLQILLRPFRRAPGLALALLDARPKAQGLFGLRPPGFVTFWSATEHVDQF